MKIVRGGAEDSLLANPAGLIVVEDSLFFFDLYDKQILALDGNDGTVLWAVGKEGSGPGEYSHPRDMKLGPDGDLWILDPENSRLTVLGRSGRTLRMLSLAELEFRPDDLIPVAPGLALFWTFDPNNPIRKVSLDSAKSQVVTVDLPEMVGLNPLASQAVLSNYESGSWAAAFAFGPYFILGGDESIKIREYVEAVDFPRVVQTTERSGLQTSTTTRLARPIFAASATVIHQDTLHILFGGRSDRKHRIIDRYSAKTGTYINSIELPRAIGAFDYVDGDYYAFFTDVYPYLARFSAVPDRNLEGD